MRLLPAGSNDAYRGAPIAWWLLVALAVGNAVRGGIHLVADDGGAASIAGIDLARGGDTIVMLFALLGIDQLVWAAIDLAVALRHRAWVAAVLLVTLVKQAAGAAVLWLWRPLDAPAPGKYAALAMLPVLAAGLVAATRARRA
jgi:hypothetical protein